MYSLLSSLRIDKYFKFHKFINEEFYKFFILVQTIPVCMTYDDLIGFYNKNKELVSENTVTTTTTDALITVR